MEKDRIVNVKIDYDINKLYIYYIQDNSHLMSNPPPPPTYYREVYSFANMKFIEKEEAVVERAMENITWKD